jgi:nitroimidazol reductase NimA-like FMN-containing flavoprotein (pyridoxamine 5'-phosphate oxidase superfamily)
MRNERHFGMSRDAALAFLAQAPVIHLATTTPDGAPVLRTLDFAWTGEAVVFHGALVGEKAACIGRPVVLGAAELVARVPSYFLDPVRADLASTLYRSVQVHGTLEEVTDLGEKARALTALMERLQPEGGYRPLDPGDPLYGDALRGVLVLRVRPERVDGKAKLGQNRTPEDRRKILEGLRRRGAAGDEAAIAAILEACGPAAEDRSRQ